MGRMTVGPGLAGLLILVMTGLATSAEFKVEPVSVAVMKSVFGQVRSKDLIPARARIGGTIAEISIAAGDHVRSNQVLARVVDEKLALQLDALNARREAIAAQLENATVNLERAKQLFEGRTIAKTQLDRQQTEFDVLSNQLNEIEAQRELSIQQAAEGTVVAPADGRILSVPVTAGSVILPGEPVAHIAGGGYFLRLYLPERHAGGIAEGDSVAVGARGLLPDSPATSLRGRIVKVYPEIEEGRVIADVEVPGMGDFYVGERTLVSIAVGTRDMLGVPPRAIVTRHGVDYVQLAEGQEVNEIAVVPGDTHETADGPLTEILTGLKAGDSVLVP